MEPLSGKPLVDKPATKPPLLDRVLDPDNARKAWADTLKVFSLPDGATDTPGKLLSGLAKIGEDVQDSQKEGLSGLAGIVGINLPPAKIDQIEAKAKAKKIVGPYPVEAFDRIGTSPTSSGADLPRPVLVSIDGGSVPLADLIRLDLVNEQRAREGRPLLPPSSLATFRNAFAPAAKLETDNVDQGDKNAPGHPLLVRLVDP